MAHAPLDERTVLIPIDGSDRSSKVMGVCARPRAQQLEMATGKQQMAAGNSKLKLKLARSGGQLETGTGNLKE
jgi:hypothetical protein